MINQSKSEIKAYLIGSPILSKGGSPGAVRHKYDVIIVNFDIMKK
jgi:hypothetical protein